MEDFGRYRRLGRIGAGSFATVYLARDEELGVQVALKVLAENWSANPEVRQRFLAEARLLRDLNDPRIIAVHDIGITERDQPYFVMEYADQGSFERLRREGVPAGRALQLCAEAARGVAVLHEHRLLHRDLTPGNVLLISAPQGTRVVLADLGVAKSLIDNTPGTLTAGTPAYMALEQARGETLDERCDIYSLAAVCYALLNGHPPFPINNLQQLLTRDWSVGPAPIADRLGAPPILDDVFGAALSPNPADRPDDVQELAEVFEQIAGTLRYDDAAEADRPAQPRAELLATASGEVNGETPGSSGASSPTGTDASGQTPHGMLDNYLGKGRYQVRQQDETHPKHFYLLALLSAAALIGLIAYLVIALLG